MPAWRKRRTVRGIFNLRRLIRKDLFLAGWCHHRRTILFRQLSVSWFRRMLKNAGKPPVICGTAEERKVRHRSMSFTGVGRWSRARYITGGLRSGTTMAGSLPGQTSWDSAPPRNPAHLPQPSVLFRNRMNLLWKSGGWIPRPILRISERRHLAGSGSPSMGNEAAIP